MLITKSNYCSAVLCPKMLWLDKHKPELKSNLNETTLSNGTNVGILAREIFGKHTNIDYCEDLSVMVQNTMKAIQNTNIIITEASFMYKNTFCSVDILKKEKDIIEIYEVKSSTEIKDIYIDDIAFQTYVLKSLGYSVSKSNIIYINADYERHGELDINKLFIIKDVTNEALSKYSEIKKRVDKINQFMCKDEEPNIDLNLNCVSPYECPFFNYCTASLPENNVFKIRGMRNTTKFKLYQNGKYSYEELLKESIDWKYKQQIEFELKSKPELINKKEIAEYLNQLSYPLYFLDFETYQQPIPEFDYVKPYMQIPFQYSLHYIEKENGIIKHREFLAEAHIDPRRQLAESLVNDIPENVCITAYNMMFEKMVIRNLANQFPDLNEHLMNIYNNMHDLMLPFKDRAYYNKEMRGSYSIKFVLPALFQNDPSLDYHNLNLIHNGSEAMEAYANLAKHTKEEQEIIRHSLLKYCELDTFAMVKIWQKLIEVTNNQN